MRTFAEFIKERPAEWRPGDFRIMPDGTPHPREEQSTAEFAFAYGGLRYTARIERASGSDTLVLNADMGKLPYSMEVGTGRRTARTIIALSESLPRGHLCLSEDDDIRLDARIDIPKPGTPANVMASVVALILDFKPYLDLLRDVLNAAATAISPPSRTKANHHSEVACPGAP